MYGWSGGYPAQGHLGAQNPNNIRNRIRRPDDSQDLFEHQHQNQNQHTQPRQAQRGNSRGRGKRGQRGQRGQRGGHRGQRSQRGQRNDQSGNQSQKNRKKHNNNNNNKNNNKKKGGQVQKNKYKNNRNHKNREKQSYESSSHYSQAHRSFKKNQKQQNSHKRDNNQKGRKRGEENNNKNDKKNNNQKRQTSYVKPVFYDVPVSHHDAEKFVWTINDFFFKRTQSKEFENHYTYEEANRLVNEKKAFVGTCSFRDNMPFLAIIDSDDFSKKIVAKDVDTNRAVEGCQVVFVPIDDDWTDFLVKDPAEKENESLESVVNEFADDLPTENVEESDNNEDKTPDETDQDGEGDDDDKDGNDENKNSKKIKEEKPAPKDTRPRRVKAKIVHILSNPLEHRTFIIKCMKDRINGLMAKYIYEKQYPFFKIDEKSQAKFKKAGLTDNYFLAKWKRWKRNSRYPTLELLEKVGTVGDVDVECQCLIKQYELPAEPYKDAIIEEIKQELNLTDGRVLEVTDEILKQRTDLRSTLILSVDPETAKDLDDALSVQQMDEKGEIFEIGVHIADVSHFVKYGSRLDSEACRRSTSYYFPQRVFPMLPEILCDNLCSLNPGVDRLAFSIFFKITKDGKRVDGDKPRIEKSVIRSTSKLSYEYAHKIITGDLQSYEDWDLEKFPVYSKIFYLKKR